MGWGEDSGGAIPLTALATGGPAATTTLSYSQLVSALTTAAKANGSASLVGNLPTTDPLATLAAQWEIVPAEAQALGLGSLFSAGSTAGTVGFGSSDNWSYGSTVGSAQYDLIGTALHELAHALGRISFDATGYYDPLNLYSYAAPGSLQLTSGQAAYFSVDGGATNLNNFDTQFDTADWASTVNGDSFGYGANGVQEKLTFTDLQVMESLGYYMAPAYNVTGPNSVNLGGDITLTVQTINVTPGTVVNYAISGIAASSLSSGGLTGTTTIGANGTATINLGIAASAPDSASTTATVSLNNGAATYAVTVGGQPFTPGHITSSQVASNNTGTVTSLSYNFSVDKLPVNGTNYSWDFDFYGAVSGNSGEITISSNGYGNQSGGTGSLVDLTVLNAASGTTGAGGTVTTSTSGGYVDASTPFSFSAGTPYTFTLTQSGSSLSVSMLDGSTNKSTLIGNIQCNTADNLLSRTYVTTSEVNTAVASAADVAPVNATWNNFLASGVVGIASGTAASYQHDATATSNGVDYATVVSPNGISQFTGGVGNDLITLSSGNNTVWLGTQPDNVVCGSSGNDIINCASQNETITMGGANASINGGTASTVVAFSGNATNYTITNTASGETVTDNTGVNGSATLQNVNFLKFANKTIYVGSALTDTNGNLTKAANIDGLYIAFTGDAAGNTVYSSDLPTYTNGTALAKQFIANAGLANDATGLPTVFKNLGLTTQTDSGPANDVANNQSGLYTVMAYWIQKDSGVIAAGGLAYATNWLVNAVASISTTTNPTNYAAYSVAAAALDTNIVNAHNYSSQAANPSPEAIGTVSLGITGVLTQPIDQAA